MKTMLKIASVLTWFNLVFWGALLGFGLLVCLVSAQLPLLLSVVLMTAIPLNCFAALKLHTSIRHTHVPFSHQTPAGIRFVGLMALFFGITFIYSGISLLADPQPGVEIYKQMLAQMPTAAPPGVAAMGRTFILIGAVAWVVLGLLVAVNVILNLRLLRWYYLVHKSDAS
ncbi:MAG TPA: hypothetical protein VL978_12045 [Puia sp.]|nr:hypothetical protein [Puia sp.]